ncbi:HLH-domain-containing protein [Tuber magnatum]|uniref:HLH-domain-containing protein n=2 Tax=Tuber magnatum TaxID=42249 RepID=A0A317SNN8_9PEZI|nr:HLH-domain-containing protein [Tuber magnatum]
MIFTPLVSPAVTPLDTNFVHQVPEFTVPGYFSPLTSPALDAHPHRTHMPNPHMMHTHSQSTSPIDPVDSQNINKRGSTGRRKSTTSRNPARVVRESPSMKAQRRKLPAALAATPELANALSKQPPTPTTIRQSASQCRGREQMGFQSSRDASSNESVSPEPLPEVLMAPPPPRNGNSRSPQNGRSDDGSSTSTTPGAPATPASLMKLTKTNLPTEGIPPIAMETSDYLNGDVERVMADAPPVSRNDGGTGGGGAATATTSPRLGGDNQSTPSAGVSKTPSLKPVPSSSSSASSGSRHESPTNIQTPSSVLNKQKVSKSGTSGRGGKRGSVSSSPGLQPKISPSIKPLLPSGMAPEASALLLKSNYQNIVEGTHKQLGLSYPADLSTNLTSKRTSHKIAEQGRRNRINNALTEIASLLPQKSTPPSSGGGSNSDGGGGVEGRGSTGGGGGGGGGGNVNTGQASKASTVEMAIDYIKQLKKELDDTKGKLADAERKLGEKAGEES